VVFLAKVYTLGDIPESEMEKIQLFEELPPNLTYPDITNTIFPYALKQLRQNDESATVDLKLSEIMEMQKQLQDKHKGKWTPLTPDYGRSCLLWMIEEIGEVVSILKKRGETYVMKDPVIREAFVEEFADILMFMNDAFMCYGISASEISNAFLKKHTKNMGRDWEKEEAAYGLALGTEKSI
jgi:NTP pyrophosphatase (non-canonical NTP hydrolase)